MKKILCVIFSVLLFSCSSKDDDLQNSDFTLNTTELEMIEGEIFRLEMKILNPTNNYYKEFVSENLEIAYVDVDGLIIARKEGNTVIRVRYNDIEKTIRISVKVRKNPLEEYYNDYCYGYKVVDTIGIHVLTPNLNDQENIVYLTGLRNKKLWIGLFDPQTKEQIKEYLDVQEFELNRKMDIGYGEFIDINISDIKLDKVYENNDGWVAFLDLIDRSVSESWYNMFHLLIFNQSDESKHYLSYQQFYSKPIIQWYDNSYLVYMDVNDYFNSNRLYTCFNSKGDQILSVEDVTILGDEYPINYDSFIRIKENYSFDVNNNNRKCIDILYTNFAHKEDNPLFLKHMFYENETSKDDYVFNSEYIELKNDVLIFKINLTYTNGEKESHKYEFDINTLMLREI